MEKKSLGSLGLSAYFYRVPLHSVRERHSLGSRAKIMLSLESYLKMLEGMKNSSNTIVIQIQVPQRNVV